MSYYTDKVAVITGAGAGMGRSLAIELARGGAQLAICDVDAVGLAETAERCVELGAPVEQRIVDVAERESMLAFADHVVACYGVVHYVFNNAGVAFFGTVECSDFKDIERVMDINFWGVVNGTKAFMPHLIASGDGHLVNTSSVFGLFGVPTQNAYNAAKFAVRGFTESLRQEMLVSGAPVTVSCVHPGGIRTDIAKNSTAADGHRPEGVLALFDKIAVTSANRAARQILEGARRGEAKILVGPDAKVMDFAVRILGSSYQRPLAVIAKYLLRTDADGIAAT
ncbi:MAG: SDR family NAD(P)-dependent oxidoreductase [Mycolicibacterium fortuitum]|uniref:SDR family NAD(P)-dependent oxidoreductase n=1 Tax=Mycolicibacterium fortuitum TaxID=1766 RepID=UPI0022BA1A64|nr:SDR family NAD(P)-dependent oxidoreductase [Mycolicibacterium fortuitum]WAY19771.1 SDR family NAD(P)-dependent oxidoreductase [Mycolicibacterium fortuitum]